MSYLNKIYNSLTTTDLTAKQTFYGKLSSTPADSDYASGEVALYVKDDGGLYKRPNGGSEVLVADGGSSYSLPTDIESGGSAEMSVQGLSGDLSAAQNPKSHNNASHSTNFASDSHDNTAHSTDFASASHDNASHSTNFSPNSHDHSSEALGETTALTSVTTDLVDSTTTNAGDLSANSTTTDDATVNNSITDPAGSTVTGGSLHLLRQAGYQTGDYVPLIYGSGVRTGLDSTNSGSYIDAANGGSGVVNWSTLSPSSGQLYVWFDGQVDALNGATMDVRVRNRTDGETMCEVLGLSATGQFEIAPAPYTPTTTSGPILYKAQILSGDGASTVKLSKGSPVIGVQV
jgi:hypothetical protein